MNRDCATAIVPKISGIEWPFVSAQKPGQWTIVV